MVLAADTGSVRAAGDSYTNHATSCLTLGKDVANAATTISPLISHVGVQTAVGAAILAVLKQLELAHGAISHAGAALPQVAEAIENADRNTRTTLSSLTPGVPHGQ